MNKRDDEHIEEHIKKIVKPIFDKVLQETNKDTTKVTVKPITFIWRPNNYRLQLNFKTETFKRNTTPNTTLKISNYGTKFTLTNFYETTIMLDIPKKKSAKVTLIYKPKTRFYYNIKCNSIDDIDTRIKEKVNDIEKKLLLALNEFIKIYGGGVDISSKKWRRHEDEIKHESFIDSLPPDLVIHDTYFKKVYPKGVEFKGPTYVKNYISNRAIESIAPDISNSINNLGNALLNELNPTIKSLDMNMKTHISVLKGIDKSFKKFNKAIDRLSQTRLNQFF